MKGHKTNATQFGSQAPTFENTNCVRDMLSTRCDICETLLQSSVSLRAYFIISVLFL